MGYDHDYSDLLHLTIAYLNLHLPNTVSHDEATKAHGLSVQKKDKSEDDISRSMNATQITAYLATTAEAKMEEQTKQQTKKEGK